MSYRRLALLALGTVGGVALTAFKVIEPHARPALQKVTEGQPPSFVASQDRPTFAGPGCFPAASTFR